MGGDGYGPSHAVYVGLLEHSVVDARARSPRSALVDRGLVVHAGRVVEHACRFPGRRRLAGHLYRRALLDDLVVNSFAESSHWIDRSSVSALAADCRCHIDQSLWFAVCALFVARGADAASVDCRVGTVVDHA